MVTTKLARQEDLQFLSVHAGRILHVRLGSGSAPTDLVNVYQYVANHKHETLERRHSLLLRLQRCVAGIPQRNTLIFSEDMNTPCAPVAKVCGEFVLPVGEYHKADHVDFMHLCESTWLCVLNTWSKPSGDTTATFTFGQLSSQIDFVITRQSTATATAKKARTLSQRLPGGVLARWSQAPPRRGHDPDPHLPLACHPYATHLEGRHRANHHRPQFQACADSLQAFRDEIAAQVSQDLDAMEKVVLQAALTHYPKKRSTTQVPIRSRRNWPTAPGNSSGRCDLSDLLLRALSKPGDYGSASHRRTAYTSSDPSPDPRCGGCHVASGQETGTQK